MCMLCYVHCIICWGVGFCGQSWLSSRPYYPTTGFRFTSSVLVFAKPLSDRPGSVPCKLVQMGPVYIWPVHMWSTPDNDPYCRLVRMKWICKYLAEFGGVRSTRVMNEICMLCLCVTLDADGCRAKSDTMSTSFVFLEGDNTVFTELTYLGSATVDAPRSETEINRNMKVLNAQSQMAIPVTLSVPAHSEGIVRLDACCLVVLISVSCMSSTSSCWRSMPLYIEPLSTIPFSLLLPL